MLDRWALELQQFDIKFQHIQGKKNVAADAIFRLWTLDQYQDNDKEDVPSTIEEIVKNTIEEIQSTDSAPKMPAYNVGKFLIWRH